MNMDTATAADQDLSGVNGGSNTLYPGGPGGSPSNAAMSNPDLLRDPSFEADPKSEYPEHVLKVNFKFIRFAIISSLARLNCQFQVYKADQTFKYLLVHKETTAHEVVMLSLQEFGNTEPSSNFTLCEVTVAEGGFVKQRRLPDALQNLAERIGLASR